jgi:hypothetical protein
MRSGGYFGVVASLLTLNGCSNDKHDDMTYRPEPAEPEAAVCEHRHDCDEDGVRIWRFPFVQIAIDPDNPKGVGVRVADDEDGYEYVDLGVSWDD